MVDFASLSALIRLAPGAILRFEGIELWRSMLKAYYLAFVSRSPGGEVQLAHSIQHRLTCPPVATRAAGLRSRPRPPNQPQDKPQFGSEVLSPPLCWRTAGGAGGAAARRPTAVATAVPPASVPAGATCRSPFTSLSDVSYVMGVVETDPEDNGGYVITYLDSLYACDWPVSDACVAQKGSDPCQAEMAAAHEHEYDVGADATIGPAGVPPGRPVPALALGVGLGGGAVVLCGLLAAAVLLTRRRRRLRYQRGLGVGPPSKEAPAALLGSVTGASPSTGGQSASAPQAGETIGTAPVSAAQPLLPTRASAADLFLAESGQVEAVRRQLAAGGQVAAVQVLEPIGQGSYARVYRGLWQGRVVALKVMMLPSGLRQQQAQMEAAVSASMNHPSIVQTYSYSFRMVLDSAFSWNRRQGNVPSANSPTTAMLEKGLNGGAGAAAINGPPSDMDLSPRTQDQPHGYELQLVLEYCDLGSLRGALDLGAFHRRGAAAATGRGGAGEDGRKEKEEGGGAGGRSGGQDGDGGDSSVWDPSMSTAAGHVASGVEVEAVRRQLAAGGQVAAVQVLELIGKGSYARVYRGLWQGRVVALKVMMLPPGLRQQQAQMEAAVSASMNHPSIVQTYSYSFRMVLDSAFSCGAGSGGAASGGDGGDGGGGDGAEGDDGDGGGGGGAEAGAGSWPDAQAPAFRYGLMLAVAYDVASALLHLHTHGIVHGDVKTCNVLLTSGSGGRTSGAPVSGAPTPRGSIDAAPGCGQTLPLGSRLSDATGQSSDIGGIGRAWSREEVQQRLTAGPVLAKLADFGLATYVDEREGTHVSATSAQGTLSHVAPELLLHGHISRHVDTYAFGILLHELFTGGRAYSGMPKALLPHQVAVQGLRPVLPPYTPPAFRLLVESCWDASPHARPSIKEVMAALQSMRAAHGAAAAAGSAGGGSAAAAAGDWEAVPPGFEVFGGARGRVAEVQCAAARSSQFSL
ncbi:Mitogen-activated protein kinase kinase kinase MLK4 [Tetrabaena socialis]|uniref:Mitogen-activated protein kinase kinase kinase MLK4 n=1 Tax=Tetrabaena socialis TaxID=47790 RepID=A0A2J8AEX1_9CHLO|nr:Mitogen-activated protein kinase kinase kinase MLK4 [Tetrabaena socialis]|eukprot:PNH11071.1 Mitogen-activated protein kinase kinase kinase MLK4 [Tetrabaena socialis]